MGGRLRVGGHHRECSRLLSECGPQGPAFGAHQRNHAASAHDIYRLIVDHGPTQTAVGRSFASVASVARAADGRTTCDSVPGGEPSQPSAEEKEVSADEGESPPPPPPKDQKDETEQPSPSEQPEQNGESKPTEAAPSESPPSEVLPPSEGTPSEDAKEEGGEEKKRSPSPEEPGEDLQTSNGDNKGKGKEVEGDSFNEVPL